MCFLIIDLDCAACALLLLWGHVEPTRPSASGLLTATLNCHFNVYLCLNFSSFFLYRVLLFLTLFRQSILSILPYSLVWPTTKTFRLDKIKLNEVAVKINHFLYQGGNKESLERKGKDTNSFLFYFILSTQSIKFPFTSFHSARTIGWLTPLGKLIIHFHYKGAGKTFGFETPQ